MDVVKFDALEHCLSHLAESLGYPLGQGKDGDAFSIKPGFMPSR